MSRSGSTLYFFINGQASGTHTATGDIYFGSVGTLGTLGGWVGHLSNVRLVVGTALYTSTFTPSTEPLTAVTNTEFLCNFTNASIYDATGKNVLETVDNAQVDTTTVKYGTGAMEFDGTGDHLATNGNPNLFAFGSGDFTIECWVYFNSLSGAQIIYDGRPSTAQTTQPTIYTSGSTLYYYTNSGNRITATTLSVSTWYHIALTRSGTDTKLFVNGTQSGSTYTDSTVYTNSDGRPFIGADSFNNGSPPGNFMNGFIDDLRITKGIARYTANFTPPTAELPVVG